MSLRDKACYTLTLVPAPKQAGVLYFVENYSPVRSVEEQSIRYGRVREKTAEEVYSATLYDAFSQAKLASTGLVNERIRSRRLELFGPDEKIPFEFTGKLGFEWSFQFEGNRYMWKRDGGITTKDMACYMDRRPDPNIDVALGRVSGRDGKPAYISILHYNIDRFLGQEIKDLRGLETLFAITFTALIDGSDPNSLSRQSSGTNAPPVAKPVAKPVGQNKPLPAGPPGPPSPPPEVFHEDANEVIVGVNTDLNSHMDRAIALLEDPNILFIIIRTKDARAAQRALQVVLGVKRFRHRLDKPDLHQYVLEEEAPQEHKGPRVIKLDDEPADGPPGWKPPPNLAIYLSTIELPDLKPGGAARANSQKRPTPVAHAHPAAMVGSPPTLSPPLPHHYPASPILNYPTSPNLRPVSPNPRPVSPNPRPMGHTGMLNAPVGGSNRPSSITGSINSGYVPPIPPPSGFQAAPSPSPVPFDFQPAPPPSGFQPNPASSGFQPEQSQWGAPGFSGGYSESPFKHGLFRPNHKH